MQLDPRQRDYAIRTVYGEDPTLSAEAVAAVIRNRTIAGRYGGKDVQGVVQAKHQFEPWNNPNARARMEGLSPDSPEYQRLGAIVDRTWSGDVPDPTNGATHFYAPKAQAALGRPAPKWDDGNGQRIGPHVFFAPEGRVARNGDAEGPPSSPMHMAFQGEQRSMDPMAYAMAQNRQQQPQMLQPQQPQPPALSPQNVMGSGALSQSNWGGLVNRDENTDLGNAMERAGLYLRDGTGAVNAAAGLKKDKGHYTLVRGADGSMYKMHSGTGQVIPVKGPDDEKVDPGTIGKLAESTDKYGQMLDTAQRAATFADDIANKKLDVSLLSKGRAYVENFFGRGSEQTQRYNDFQTFTQELVNNVLLQHKGVQTEGDAQRAAKLFTAGLANNDNNAVKNALERLIDLNGEATTRGQKMLEPYKARYKNSGVFAPFEESFKQQQQFYTDRASRRQASAPETEAPTGLPKGVRSINIVQ